MQRIAIGIGRSLAGAVQDALRTAYVHCLRKTKLVLPGPRIYCFDFGHRFTSSSGMRYRWVDGGARSARSAMMPWLGGCRKTGAQRWSGVSRVTQNDQFNVEFKFRIPAPRPGSLKLNHRREHTTRR